MARTKVPVKRNLPKRNTSAGKRQKVIQGIDETDAPEAVGSRVTRSNKAPEIPNRLDQRFKTPNYRDLYNRRFGTRKIAPGRIVDFKSFDSCKAAFVRKWFQAQNLDKLMEDKEPIYPDLVRQFYTHFDKSNEQEGVIHSWVKGRVIVLDEKTLRQILGIPAAGVHDSTGKKWSTHEVFDKDQCIKRVLMDNDAERDTRPLTEELPMPTRLLHLILMYTFISREGRKSSMTYLDLFVMYCVLTKVKVNMPRMIINCMVAVNLNKSGGVLPYGMWLTKVFNWFGVDLKDEPVTRNSKRKLSSTTITGDIGYNFDDETGLWNKRGIKRAPKKEVLPSTPEKGKGKAVEDDGEGGKDKRHGCCVCASSQESMLESIVVQEMLRLIHPDAFTLDTMEAIRETAKIKMAKHLAQSGNILGVPAQVVDEGSGQNAESEDNEECSVHDNGGATYDDNGGEGGFSTEDD